MSPAVKSFVSDLERYGFVKIDVETYPDGSGCVEGTRWSAAEGRVTNAWLISAAGNVTIL